MVPGGEEGNRAGSAVPNQSLGALFRQLLVDASELVRSELELAKQELLDKLKSYQAATISLGIGALICTLGLFMLCAAAFIGLAVFLGYGLSALSLGILLTLVGTIVTVSAVQKFKQVSLAPRKTIETLKETKEWLRESS